MVTLDDEQINEDGSDGGAELKGYFKNEKIVKMFHWLGISYGNRIKEFYFKEDHLIFVYEKFESFIQTKNGLDHSKTKTSFEGRYYFNKGKLIEQKITGKKPLLDKDANIEKELKEEAQRLRLQLGAIHGEQ
jgi:hypothetical protein